MQFQARMQKILISACLIGEPVRYDGRIRPNIDPTLIRWHRQGFLVPFCPEVAGGLPVPRLPAEISSGQAGSGREIRIFSRDGRNVTEAFAAGAQKTLDLCIAEGIRQVIFKDGSPSCGSSYIYDGTFSGRRIPGMGLTAVVLESAGIRVFSEHNFTQAFGSLASADGIKP